MSKCHQCKVEIKDNVTLCPLCKSVLEKKEPIENVYPNVRVIIKKHHLWTRIYLFAAIVAETLLLFFNYKTYHGSLWAVVAGVVLFYGYIGLKFTFMDNMEYKTRIIILIMIAIFGVILIDLLTGFDGWSLNYFIPGGIILMNTAIIVLMIINIRNWQSYMMIELLTILWSLVPFVLIRSGLPTNLNVSLGVFAYSIFLFLGTILIGGKRASTELKRRFHVR